MRTATHASASSEFTNDGRVISYPDAYVSNGEQGDEGYLISDLAQICGVDRSPSFPLDLKVISLPQGTRSIPVAYSQNDSFAYVLKGSGTCWIDGHTYELDRNDCLGVPGGSGSALSFISEQQGITNDEDNVMEVLLIVEKREDNQLYYPLPGKVFCSIDLQTRIYFIY